jgi:hypothetical protein
MVEARIGPCLRALDPAQALALGEEIRWQLAESGVGAGDVRICLLPGAREDDFL